MPFETVRDVLAARGKDLAGGLAVALWAVASLAAFQLAPDDRLSLGVPLAGAVALQLVPWSRRNRAALLLAALGLYGGLAALEIGVRLRAFGPDALTRPADYAPYAGIEGGLVSPVADPALGFGLTPGYRGRYQGREMRVNAQGFRGDDFRETPSAGIARVMAFGSSITMGAGVPVDDTYPAATARALRASGIAAEGLDLGTPAYTVAQIFALAERMAPRYRPDAVVVELSSGAVRGSGVDTGIDVSVAAARTAGQGRSTVERYSFAATAIYPPADLRATLTRLTGGRAPTQPAQGTTTIEERIRSLADLGRRQGFAVVILIVRPMTAFDRPDLDRAERARIAEVATSAGALAVDTYPLFGGGDFADDFIIFPGDLHPNARAHARFAQGIADALAARLRR